MGNVGEAGHLLDGFSDDFCRALGTVRRPVLVATEVEVVGLLLVGQRRQVGHVITHFREAAEHRLVVVQGLLVIELVAFGGEQLVAVHQAAGRLVDHHQFDALALERIMQLLQTLVAGWRGVELGTQVFLGTEQPVALGLYQGGEVLLVAGHVVLGIVGCRAEAAARFCREFRCLDFLGPQIAAGGEDRGGQGGQEIGRESCRERV